MRRIRKLLQPALKLLRGNVIIWSGHMSEPADVIDALKNNQVTNAIL